ncbi:glycosyltransferase [Dolichospermum sp. ST_con]|nr:glycosyltransferase [Dolichospermum sp. ST_con]MDD1421706.1 glycosyltransferase [Dolichospermum sp. ST_sed1]MDD1425881.1 glycosyltransferase [Dolichospermum sp. ST_sed9]MDD1431521.1 glycosyltransferase [Dolichospermum sp. ST_sed6]MDD1436879.1 glycosyltransferase [Dolichospermum sp. ST_sed10]MDD1442477.1 glycosyltransferase [Dolichospermum sp. ST_sed3]MDD1446017.1 glycosyltransferase [Dolichospermum sp. ST_sed8]MDD1461614.1 glycosyltransferase [Dolichospermum sp. ST_sed2]MDD1468549.1 glyc
MNTNSSNSLLVVPTGALRISEFTPEEIAKNNPILLSLVIPTYKERDNIENVVNILTGLLDQVIPGNYELIIVDDDSPDRTWEVAQSLIPDYPQLRVMRREEERGLSSAVIRGWQAATGRVLGVIDGDLQHPPKVLTQLLQKIEQGADLALASRHVDGGGVSSWSVIRRFLSRGAQVLGLVILPGVLGRVTDPMSGYFMVRRSAIANTTLNPIGYKILIEVISRGQVGEIAEAGYVFRERTEGESKVTWKQYIEYIQHLIRLRISTGRIGKISKKVNFPVQRFLRFGLVGLSGVFVDMLILYLLSDPTTLALPLTRSKIIAGEIAIFNNFLWNDAWTFADVSMQQKGWKPRLKRFLKFNVVCLAGLVLNVLILNLVFNFLIPNRYIANFTAIAIATIWNFWVNLKLSWRVTEVK